MRKLITIGILSMFLFLVLMPSISSVSTYKIEKNNEDSSDPMKLSLPVYVGEIYIDGDGDRETAIVRATSEQSLEIPIPRDGVEVEFKMRYRMSCRGFNDRGKAHLWIRGADSVEAVTGEYEEGYLYTTKPNCNRGDTVEWTLSAYYIYFIGREPVIDIDAGAGVFPRPRSNEMPLFRLLNLLFDKQILLKLFGMFSISGTITFK